MLKTISPIDNKVYVERECATYSEIESILNLSKKSFYQWKTTPLSVRKEIVTNFVDIFLNNNLEIENQLCQQRPCFLLL